MAEFKLKITADAQGAVGGAKDAKDALSKLGAEGRKANEEIAESAKRATGAKQDFKKVLNALTHEFPLLGAAARMAVNPVVAAATLGAMAFKFLRAQVSDFEAAIEQTEWQSYGKKAQEAAKAVGAVRDAAKEAADASERLMDVFRAQQAAEERLDEARKRVEVAAAQGDQDPVRRAQKLLEIEERYSRLSLQRELRGQQMTLQAQEQRAAAVRAKAGQMGTELTGLRAAQERVGRPEDLKREIEVLEQRLEATRKDKLAQEDRSETMYGNRYRWWFEPGYSQRAYQAWSQAQSLGQQQTGIERVLADRRQRLRWSEGLGGRIGALEEQYPQLLQSAQGIESMLPTQRAVAGIAAGAARGAAGLETQERALRARNEAGESAERLLQSLVQAIESNKGMDRRVLEELDGWSAWRQQMEARVANLRNR